MCVDRNLSKNLFSFSHILHLYQNKSHARNVSSDKFSGYDEEEVCNQSTRCAQQVCRESRLRSSQHVMSFALACIEVRFNEVKLTQLEVLVCINPISVVD